MLKWIERIDYMLTLKAAYDKDLLDKEGEYLALAQLLLFEKKSLLGCTSSCCWSK